MSPAKSRRESLRAAFCHVQLSRGLCRQSSAYGGVLGEIEGVARVTTARDPS